MIDERMEEQASLYVLGTLPPEDQTAFEAALNRSAELRQLVDALRVSRDALAGTVPLREPPLQLKQRILEKIAPPQKIPERSARAGSFSIINLWAPWALAASLAVLCSVLFWQHVRLNGQLSAEEGRWQALNQIVTSLQDDTNRLQQQVVALRETNQLEGLRIAMLNSLLKDSPKAIAVSLWDNESQKGVIVVQNLKPSPANWVYQLWIMDPKYDSPVNAGVFQVDEQGNVRVQFTAGKPIASADKFAVTMEPTGGRPTPTLKNLVLMGS